MAGWWYGGCIEGGEVGWSVWLIGGIWMEKKGGGGSWPCRTACTYTYTFPSIQYRHVYIYNNQHYLVPCVGPRCAGPGSCPGRSAPGYGFVWVPRRGCWISRGTLPASMCWIHRLVRRLDDIPANRGIHTDTAHRSLSLTSLLLASLLWLPLWLLLPLRSTRTYVRQGHSAHWGPSLFCVCDVYILWSYVIVRDSRIGVCIMLDRYSKSVL